MRIRTTVLTLVVFSLLWSSAAIAQQRPSTSSGRPEPAEGRHVVEPAVVRQAVAEKVATNQQNRDALIDAMRRPDVRALAGRLGLNLTRAENAVAALNSVELARLATPTRAADTELAGGSNTIVISTTTLLLIIIIIILLVR